MLTQKKSFFFYLLLSIAILTPLFQSTYILTLDMLFPSKAFTTLFHGFEPPIGGSLLIYATLLIPNWILQKIYLLLILVLAGISAHTSIPVKSQLAKYFAGILYTINPYVYVRFLAGHWLILLAYAITPLALKAFIDLLENPSRRSIIKALFWLTLVGVFNVHTLILNFIACIVILFFKIVQAKHARVIIEKQVKPVLLLAVGYIFLNTYWLLPLLTAKQTILQAISQSDLYFFAPRVFDFNAVFTIASMYGFWRGGYLYARDLLPFWYLFYFIILFLAVHGFISNYKDEKIGIYVKSFGFIAVIALILGTSVSGPFSGIAEFLFNNVYIFRGFRDSHKFVALLVLAYAYLGALGVAEIEKSYREAKDKRRKVLALSMVVLALATPFIYSFTMFNGFWGQLKPTDYPEDWYEVNIYLNQDREDFNVLFLPWHLYMDFSWIPNSDKRIANPAASFFDKNVIQGDNIEVPGIYSQSINPVSRYIEFLLANRNNISNFGELISPLNVKYILLTKEVDYKEYFFLFNQSDLELVKETEHFYVFKNKHVVAKFYEVDEVREIKSWNELLEISKSKNEDILDYAFTLGNNTTMAKPSKMQLLNYTQESPVKYSLEKPSKRYIIFTTSYSEEWSLGGKKPFANLGAINAFDVEGASDTMLYYERFYTTYVPAYAISLITLIVVALVYFEYPMPPILRRSKK
jgi:hypothetical protein